MINFFTDFFEDVRKAARKSIKEIKGDWQQEKIKSLAERTKKELRRATPKSKITTLHGRAQTGEEGHARDLWEIEYEQGVGGKITGFEIINPRDYIDYLEYGTPPHGPVMADAMMWTTGGEKIFASFVKGIKPMGFTRKVQEEMDRGLPAWIREAILRPIEKHWA